MGKVVLALLSAANLSVLGLAVYFLTLRTSSEGLAGAWSHAEILTVVLMAVTVILTVVVIGLAVLAIFGFWGIKALVQDEAERAARAAVQKSVGYGEDSNVSYQVASLRDEDSDDSGPIAERTNYDEPD